MTLTASIQFYTFVHMAKNPQLELLAKQPNAYGGTLLKKRKARRYGRSLSTKYSMHMVLRSSKARGEQSFRRHKNAVKVRALMNRFALKNGVKVISLANVGNHLHIHLQLSTRHTYKAFIRGLTSAIAMAISGHNRWTKKSADRLKFWDYRPFTRIVTAYRALLTLRDYIWINQLEGFGYARTEARYIVRSGWSSA